MLTSSLGFVLLAAATLVEARTVEPRHLHAAVHKRANNNDATGTTLSSNAVQSGSFNDGSNEIGANILNQAKSLTSQNNFINNCAGKTLTNGLQITTGSCNGITMGDIPAKTSMVSSIITFPLPGSASIQSDTTFNITVQMANLVAGSFTNADATYYAAPQQLSGGKIIGHTHVTVQDMGSSLNPKNALDATQFAFFKGINDAGNGNGLLSATVTGGLPAGNYRVCTMAAASNHQPVLMPVAQRGTPDDCTKFTVIGNGKTANVASNNGAKGQAAAALAASAVAAGPDVAASSISSSASSTSTSVKGKGGKGVSAGGKASTSTQTSGKGGKGTSTASVDATSTSKGNGKGGKGNKNLKTTTSATAASTTTDSSKGSKNLNTSTTSAAASSNTKDANKGGNKGGKGGSTVKKVVEIETFFEFILSLGGLPPSVGKNGESFAVLEEVFVDLKSAASAACGHQFESCATFSGPGFSVEECEKQKVVCFSAASTATATASQPAKLTATVTVPATATVTGSVLATVATVSTSGTTDVGKAQNTAPPALGSATNGNNGGSKAKNTPAPIASSSSVCTIVTQTVEVDAASTPAAAPATSSSASPSSSSSSGALGGIAAPPVTNSGDSTRPFEINGNTFVNKSAAVQRSCDIQFNACANAVNGQKLQGVTVSDCQKQQQTCSAQA